MGKIEDSPIPLNDLQPPRRDNKQKKIVELTICRNLEENLWNLSPPKVQEIHPTESVSFAKASAEVYLDLPKLFNCDVIARQFLLPFFSFQDLVSLEATSNVIRDIVRSKRWWRVKVDEFRQLNKKEDRLLSRYSSALSPDHPDYHKKMISKLFLDTSKVHDNLKGRTCKKCCKAFSLETTCHKAFTVNESGQLVFILNDTTCEVLSLETSKSKRGVELQLRHKFEIVQMEQYCSLLLAHRDFLFHVTYRQFHAWNWKNGARLPFSSPSEKDLLGLGLVKSLVVDADVLTIGSNDAGGSLQQPTTGAALVQMWRFTYPELTFSLLDKITQEPDLPEDAPQHGVIGKKPTSISLDARGGLLAIAYGFYFFSPFQVTISSGKIVFYDLSAKKVFGAKSYKRAVTCIRVNATQRKAIVGIEKRASEECSYLEIVDVDSGQSLKSFYSQFWGPRCLWTDWQRHIFTGDDDGLMIWGMNVNDDYVDSCQRLGLDTGLSLSGCNGLPATDRICDLFFDGFHLIVFTRGSTKATVRVLDFLKLSSTKF